MRPQKDFYNWFQCTMRKKDKSRLKLYVICHKDKSYPNYAIAYFKEGSRYWYSGSNNCCCVMEYEDAVNILKMFRNPKHFTIYRINSKNCPIEVEMGKLTYKGYSAGNRPYKMKERSD